MSYNRPIVLSIAGFDPTGGAGVLADCKTFEQHQCLGMGILSSNTLQTDSTFVAVDWVDAQTILKQVDTLFETYSIHAVKIGLIENLKILSEIIDRIRFYSISTPIVWDPILKASAGFEFHTKIRQEELFQVLDKISLVTPNSVEILKLTTETNELKAAQILAQHTKVLLKGGHSTKNKGLDYLVTEQKTVEFSPNNTLTVSEKHGSGCILSSAITANLAHQKDLVEAIESAKKYTEQVLASNPNLLAYHVA